MMQRKMMMKKNTTLTIFVIAAILFSNLAFAISQKSEDALNAFRRYEPDFRNTLRRLEELDRRVDSLKIAPDSERMQDIKEEAEESMTRIQKRYDLMEDLFTYVSGAYPADRPQLFDGFSRIDDLYREIRDFYAARFVYRGQKQEHKTVPAAGKTTEETTGTLPETSEPVTAPAAAEPEKSGSESAAPDKKESKIDVSGVLKLELKNRNEIYRVQTNALPVTTPAIESALPNNLRQGKLNLTYKFDEKRQLFVEDRFLKRERNEPVHENYFTLAYLIKQNQDRAWTIKNTLQHSWYPDNGIKDYRNNLAEVFFNDHWTKRERLANVGYQTRVYPNYSRSDFYQMNLGDQETWFRDNGNMFLEFKGEWRRYSNVNDLDYDNANLYGEYNRTYSGNKSELAISNTFDRRLYDQEAVNLYRASYFDNYFRLNYELPVHSKLAYSFEGQHSIRSYTADEPRGYKEVNLFAAARIKIDDKTRTVYDYRFVHNDENSRDKAHKNHKLHSMWQKNFSDDFRARWDSNYHIRTADVTAGEDMEFKENLQNVKLSWRLKNQMNLVWNNEYLSRIYERLGYRDYQYFMSGLALSYARAQKYDWKIDQSWRKFNFRNGTISTGWEGESQPITEIQYNCTLSDDLKLRLRASWEKSYYRQFDAKSQELLWDFTRPMTISEFYGGLEYVF